MAISGHHSYSLSRNLHLGAIKCISRFFGCYGEDRSADECSDEFGRNRPKSPVKGFNLGKIVLRQPGHLEPRSLANKAHLIVSAELNFYIGLRQRPDYFEQFLGLNTNRAFLPNFSPSSR